MKNMIRSIRQIAADFDALSASDFNLWNVDANGIERLHSLTEELVELNAPDEIAEILFNCIERLSRSDEIDPRYDLGTPGSLVHALEKLPNYREHLIASVKRYPTPLTVWMINRILNMTGDTQEREFWRGLMDECLNHPMLSPLAREDTEMFLKHQSRLGKFT